jgi:hypothetical protein
MGLSSMMVDSWRKGAPAVEGLGLGRGRLGEILI